MNAAFAALLVACADRDVALSAPPPTPPTDGGLDAGAVDATADASSDGVDGGARCDTDPSAPIDFADVEVPGADAASGLAMTRDERTIVFARLEPEAGARRRLYIAARAEIDAPFSAAAPLALADPGESSWDPWLVDDGRELVWRRSQANVEETRISTRQPDGSYDAGEAITIEGAPTVGRFRVSSPVLVADALYYVAPEGLMRAPRVAHAAFGTATLQVASFPFEAPLAVTADERTLYTSSGYEQMSRRASASGAWGPLTPWPTTYQAFAPRWVSADECRVYVRYWPYGAQGSHVGVIRRRPR